jgi:hypothetical protein
LKLFIVNETEATRKAQESEEKSEEASLYKCCLTGELTSGGVAR